MVTVTGLDAHTSSYFLKNFMAISGELTRITCTFLRRTQAISVFKSVIRLCIHLYLGFFLQNSGIFPTIGHGFGQGGSGARLLFVKAFEKKMEMNTRKNARNKAR